MIGGGFVVPKHSLAATACVVAVLMTLPGSARATSADLTAERYDLTLSAEASRGSFAGSERIDLRIEHAVSEIRLDAQGLVISGVEASIAGQRLELTHRETEGSVFVRFAMPVPPGHLSVELRWSGRLSEDLRGIYSIRVAGRTDVFTQLEPRAARRVFPCLDAPYQRARFSIHVVVQGDEQAVSNGAVASEELDATRGLKTINFAETPPIPAYLVSLAIGRFDIRADRAGRTPVRIVTVEGEGKRARAALRRVHELLPQFESYLGVPFPFDKLDIVAVPQLAPHAMENAGAVFVRADELLLDEPNDEPAAEMRLTRRLAHELAHHWFGDLVTMASWHDLWLSEALARWAEFELIDQLRPDWHMWEQFHVLRDQVLTQDVRESAHAIRTTATRDDPAFDTITYDKGAATLRMIQRWIGEDSFRAALHDYLTSHAFGAASGEDFWRALATRSSPDVEALAKDWFESPGHPLLELAADCHGGALDVRVSQHAAFTRGRPPAHKPWIVPLVVRTPTTTLRLIVRSAQLAIRLRESEGCPSSLRTDGPGESPYQLRYVTMPFVRGGTAVPRHAAVELLPLQREIPSKQYVQLPVVH